MTAKFDPAKWWVSNYSPDVSTDDMARALAAEAAKQQARRDAEICREYPKRDPAEDGNGYWAADDCAQAIEREAGL